MNIKKAKEDAIHFIFLILGLIAVGSVLVITIYLVISGLPAIREIGLADFLFGRRWASTAAEPEYGILPFILTSIYGTAGAIVIGVPIGFFAAVYLAKMAPRKVCRVMELCIGVLAGIPSVVYGLVGMLILIPAIMNIFNVPDGASLLAAIIVLAVMILPSVINVSLTSLQAVPREYEEASLALGATIEAENTASFLREMLARRFPRIRISRLAQGIPLGAEVKYMDRETLRQSLQYRQDI